MVKEIVNIINIYLEIEIIKNGDKFSFGGTCK